MKRILSVLLALLLCLFLFACGAEESLQADRNSVITCYPAPEDETPPAQEPVTPPEEPVPADPLPGEKVAPEPLQIKHSHPMFTFADDKEEPLLILTASIPDFGLSQITDYYTTLYDDLYAICQLNTEDAARQKAELQALGQEFTPWTVRMLPVITHNDGVTLSMMRTVIEKLGEQETQRTYGETFDVASQGRLLLGDLFQKNTDYVSRLPVTEPDQLNFSLTDGFLMLYTETETVSVPLSDLSDILLPQYVTE